MKKKSFQKIRQSWGSLSPVTRIKPSRKAYKRRPKHQGRDY